MNTLTWILMGALVLLHCLDLLADILNLRSINPKLPREFADVYDDEEYARMQRYEAADTRLGAVKTSIKLAILITFWLLGGFQALDTLVRGMVDGALPRGLLYIGILYLGATLISLPFAIYNTFVVEQRFGFNKTNPLTFLSDQIRGLLLASLLGAVLISLLLWLLERIGPDAWLWAWIVVSGVMICIMYIAPALILPLFNKFTPLEDGELKEAVLDYARREHFPLKGLYVMDGSRRSTRANAFFTGFGRTRKIVLFDTLIEKHSTAELLAVLAHEIGHFKLHHIQRHMIVATLNLGLFLYLASFALYSPALFTAFGVREPSTYVGLALFTVLFSPLSQLISVGLGYMSRLHEYQADAFSARTTGQPESLVSALKQLSRSNLTNLAPHPLQVALHHSHPPVLSRIQALQSGPIAAKPNLKARADRPLRGF